MSSCSYCSGLCVDPHTEDLDIEKLLDAVEGCPFHGDKCEVTYAKEAKHEKS